MACQLRCVYCTVSKYLLDEPSDNVLQDRKLREVLEVAPPSHIYISGGEPLLHPDTIEFVQFLGRQGHVASFDTKLTHNASWLARLLDKLDPSWIGYFDISHHVEQRVPVKTIIAATKFLRDRNLNHHVKYLGRPEDFSLIDDCIPRIEDAGFGVSLTIQSGRTTDDRRPSRTVHCEERIWLLERIRLRCSGACDWRGIAARPAPK